MDIINLVISLVSGAIGGNAAGAALPEKSLGTVGNTIAGLIGGGAGDFLLKTMGILATTNLTTADGSIDISSILANIAASGVGGGVLTAVIALVKDAMDKK